MRQKAPPPRGNRKTRSKPSGQKRSSTKVKDNNTEVRKSGNVYYLIQKQPRRIPWRWVIAIILVFAGAIGSAYSFAQIHYVQREISTSRANLNNIRYENRNLEAQLAGNYSRDEIERLAYERLNMGEPELFQIIDFYVPHQSIPTLAIEDPTPPPQTGFWQNIAGFFQRIWARTTG